MANCFADVSKRLGDLHQASAVALDYQKTLLLLRALKAGEVSLDQVQMTADGWQLVDVVEPASEVAEPESN